MHFQFKTEANACRCCTWRRHCKQQGFIMQPSPLANHSRRSDTVGSLPSQTETKARQFCQIHHIMAAESVSVSTGKHCGFLEWRKVRTKLRPRRSTHLYRSGWLSESESNGCCSVAGDKVVQKCQSIWWELFGFPPVGKQYNKYHNPDDSTNCIVTLDQINEDYIR